MPLALVDHGSEAATAIASQSAARANPSRSTSLPIAIFCVVAACAVACVVAVCVVAVCAVTVGTTASMNGRMPAKHHAAEHANAKYVYPAEREFQQVGVEYARQNILDDHADPEPSHQSATSEQQEVRYPDPE